MKPQRQYILNIKLNKGGATYRMPIFEEDSVDLLRLIPCLSKAFLMDMDMSLDSHLFHLACQFSEFIEKSLQDLYVDTVEIYGEVEVIIDTQFFVMETSKKVLLERFRQDCLIDQTIKDLMDGFNTQFKSSIWPHITASNQSVGYEETKRNLVTRLIDELTKQL